ncbi:MAG: acyl-CoA synthetase [Deltaproteobacteria bacterium]|nr:acyl-CoA synthetase [Deltaproteobacteria bacterium]
MESSHYNIAVDCVDKQVQSITEKTAMRDVQWNGSEPEIKQITYGELSKQSHRFANALLDVAIKPGDRLLLRLPNRIEFAVAFFGAMRAGVIPVPTSPLLTEYELEFLVNDSGAVGLVTTLELLPNSKILPKIIVVAKNKNALPLGAYHYETLIKRAIQFFKPRTTQAEDPAYWLYTSGTEKEPKGVIHAHRSIPAHDARVRLWQNLYQTDIAFNTSDLNWSYGLTCGWLDILRQGATAVVYNGPLQPENIYRVIQECEVTVFMSVPGIYRRLVRYLEEKKEEGFGRVRVALSAGEKIPKETRQRFRKRTGLQIYEGLGMTEHSVYLIQRYGEKPVAGSCGSTLPEHRVTILRENLTEAPPGEAGILASHRSCPGLMLGYHNRPEEEKRVLTEDWFLSDDTAKRDAEGNFYFLGRRDDVITAGGYRISPTEVEAVLNQSPDVAESAVIGAEVEKGKSIVKAFVVPATGADASDVIRDRILQFTSAKLARYKVPREIVFLESIPKTHNGKLKRAALRGEHALNRRRE